MDTATHQRFAVSALIGQCEQIVGSGVLAESVEQKLRALIASTLNTFRMPSISERNVVQIGDHDREYQSNVVDVARREMAR